MRRINWIRRAWRLANASRATMLSWNAAAYAGLRSLATDMLSMSVVVFVFAAALTGVAHDMNWVGLKVGVVFTFTLLYLGLLAVLARTNRALHAAGLLFEFDLVRNLGRVLRHVDIEEIDTKGVAALKMPAEFKAEFVAMQFAKKWLWVAVCIELNAFWFLLVIPVWDHPVEAGIMMMSGLYWTIARKPVHFEWFKWFGSILGYYGFVGGATYILATHYQLHPYPIIPALVAGAAVMLANQHQWWNKWHGLTKPLAVAAALLLVLAPYIGIFQRIVNQAQMWNNGQQTLANVPLGIPTDINIGVVMVVGIVAIIVGALKH